MNNKLITSNWIFFLLTSIIALLTLSSCQIRSSHLPLMQPSVAVAADTPTAPPSLIADEPEEENEEDNPNLPPLYIEALRNRAYPASPLTIEQTLPIKDSYIQYIAWYLSDGLKIYGLLTIPTAEMPENGFPAILFLHGYIPPEVYNPTSDYMTSQDALARSGFVTFKPDMRGHWRSEGMATGTHFSEAYIVDSLNALSALLSYEKIDPRRIGVWGHSNGGLIGLRMAVVSDQVKASVFWGGVVGSYQDMLETYFDRIDFLQRLAPPVIEANGLPSENPEYWSRIDPFAYLDLVNAPVQLHHGDADSSVPVELSVSLFQVLKEQGKEVELFRYDGMGHNFYGEAFNDAMRRTVEFFDDNLRP